MRSITFLAALLGAASATPTSVTRPNASPDSIAHATDVVHNDISARAADNPASDKARFTFINNLGSQQKLYIVGRSSGQWVFVKNDGSIVYVRDMHSTADLNSVAIPLGPNQRGLAVDIPRPLTQGRVYSAEDDLYFNINGGQLGHPHSGQNPQNEGEAIRWNFVDFQVEESLATVSGAVQHSDFIGTPSMSISIKSSDGRTEESAQGFRSDCVQDFCGRARGADQELCVFKNNRPLRIFVPWSVSQQEQGIFSRVCKEQPGKGTVVVRNANQMTITVG